MLGAVCILKTLLLRIKQAKYVQKTYTYKHTHKQFRMNSSAQNLKTPFPARLAGRYV